LRYLRKAGSTDPYELEQLAFSFGDKYIDVVLEIICLLNEGISQQEIIERKKFGFNGKFFDNSRENLNLRISYIVNPPSIEGGKIRCKKCGSKSTISRLVQLRSADEPASQLVTCRECNEKWRIG